MVKSRLNASDRRRAGAMRTQPGSTPARRMAPRTEKLYATLQRLPPQSLGLLEKLVDSLMEPKKPQRKPINQ